MTIENDFLPFAISGGANVIDQPTYLGSSYLGPGRASGILPSNVYNKIARQSSIAAYLLGQLIVDETGQTALDNGDVATLLANFKTALSNIAIAGSALSVVTASGVFVTPGSGNQVIGLDRTTSPAPSSTTLPAWAGLINGQTFEYEDLARNFNGFNVTVNPPPGATIAGLPGAATLNINGQCSRFRYYTNGGTPIFSWRP